ncbi:MAG: hypothetical protein IKV94_02080 [Clostridia bacterium]|nr:hypothetical protein [Clostridia bacterium]
MQDENMANVASELYEIFKYLDEDILKKIPEDLKKQIDIRRNPNYRFNLDKNKDLKYQNIMEETKQVLSVMYLRYCCTEEEVEEILDKHYMIKREEEEQKIGLEELQAIFNNSQRKVEPEDEKNQIIKIETTPWYIKVIDKIKLFFRIKK